MIVPWVPILTGKDGNLFIKRWVAEILKNSNPDYGLVNEQADRDGFSRQYYTFFTLDQNPGVWYPSLGIKAIQRYLDFPD